jgi:hypothetical protein
MITNQLIPTLSSFKGDKTLHDQINMERYRFSQKAKLKNKEIFSFPSLPNIPSLPSVPGSLNSNSVADAAAQAAQAAGAGKNALGDLAKSLFGNNDEGKPEENKPSTDGKFRDPQNLMPNSVASASLPRSWSDEENKNLLPAMSGASSPEDPTKANDNKSIFDAPTAKNNDGGKPNPDPIKGEESDLPGKKVSNPTPANDIASNSQKGPDPVESLPDKKDDGDENEKGNFYYKKFRYK